MFQYLQYCLLLLLSCRCFGIQWPYQSITRWLKAVFSPPICPAAEKLQHKYRQIVGWVYRETCCWFNARCVKCNFCLVFPEMWVDIFSSGKKYMPVNSIQILNEYNIMPLLRLFYSCVTICYDSLLLLVLLYNREHSRPGFLYRCGAYPVIKRSQHTLDVYSSEWIVRLFMSSGSRWSFS